MYTLGFFSEIGEAIMDSLRTFMLTLCDGIYRLIYFTFYVFEKLGTATIIQEEQVQDIFTRVGLIIGIFMVFRLTFAFIQYIIDPDSMVDNKKGAGNIIKKIIIAIVLLGSTSTIFKLAFRAQDLIVDSHIISKIIFNNDVEETESFGGRLSSEVFTAFYRLNDEAETAGNDCESYFINNENTNVIKANIAQKNGSLDIAYTCLTERDSNGNYLVSFDGGGLIALVVGVVVLYTVIIFTIQVGVRLVQLAYLQIIAPIPIIMYVTPKGDEYLKKWGTQCLTTFLDFFLRTAIIYFAIAIIQNIIESGTIGKILTGGLDNTSGWQTAYIFVIMVIAVLVFAKKVPALLKEIFPSLGGAAGFDYGLSFKKQVVEPLKTAYNSPLGWLPKLAKKGVLGTVSTIDRKVNNLPKPRSPLQQKLDKLTPGRAEVIKNRAEQEDRRNLYEEGRQIYDRYGGEIKYEDGENKGKLKPKVFTNEAFIKTWQEVADAKALQKKYDAELTQAQARLNRGEITIESQEWKDAVGNAKAASGRLDAAKKDHENNRKIYSKDARIEDAFNYYHDMQFGESTDANQQDIGSERTAGIQNNSIITEEHVQSHPRQDSTSTSPQDEYSRLVSQYNGETDPSKKAELRRQIEEFERRH